jgi:hypothetical protein
MSLQKLTAIEIATLVLVTLMVIAGFILFYTNLPLFINYTEEDHLVEWLTVLGLLAGCAVSLSRLFQLFRKKSWWFLLVTLGLALVLFFGAGEEISWGQRIFHIKSSSFFEKNNTQHEMNFHNLIVDGIKVNKAIFSIGLIICMGLYLIVLPIVYQTIKPLRRFTDYSGVPVPRIYQIVSFLLLFLSVSLLHHEKNAELLECGTALLLFLVIAYPKNKNVFLPSQTI